MTDRATIRALVERYIAAMNSGEIDDIPLTDDIEFAGAMLAEPRVGAAAVREHLSALAPFVDMELVELIVEDDAAAAVVRLRTVSGQELLSVGLFHFRDGAIRRHRGFTDTHQLFTGQR
jgi:hypothetical protein